MCVCVCVCVCVVCGVCGVRVWVCVCVCVCVVCGVRVCVCVCVCMYAYMEGYQLYMKNRLLQNAQDKVCKLHANTHNGRDFVVKNVGFQTIV